MKSEAVGTGLWRLMDNHGRVIVTFENVFSRCLIRVLRVIYIQTIE